MLIFNIMDLKIVEKFKIYNILRLLLFLFLNYQQKNCAC